MSFPGGSSLNVLDEESVLGHLRAHPSGVTLDYLGPAPAIRLTSLEGGPLRPVVRKAEFHSSMLDRVFGLSCLLHQLESGDSKVVGMEIGQPRSSGR
jgi:hypothetical protein